MTASSAITEKPKRLRCFYALTLVLSLFTTAQTIAREITDSTAIVAGKDWRVADRIAWDQASQKLSDTELVKWAESHPNSFFEACLQNTIALRPAEFESVRQRHSYYDYMAFYLSQANAERQTLKDIKFFAATTSVTIRGELGLVEGLIASKGDSLADLFDSTFPIAARFFKMTSDSAKTLTLINERLFLKNMRVLRDLIQIWKAPRDPRAAKPRDTISGFDFDMAMVEFEQSEVQNVIDNSSVSQDRIKNINKLMQFQKKIPSLTLVRTLEKWAAAAGWGTLDFGDKGWRIAIGRALVFHFHGKSRSEYLKFMKANPVEKSGRPKFYDGLQAPNRYSVDESGKFAMLGSWKSELGARRHVAELHSRFPGIQLSIFPPYGKNRYWSVMGAAFVPEDTAKELSRAARQMGLARDAIVVSRHAIDPLGVAQIPKFDTKAFDVAQLIKKPPAVFNATKTGFLSVGGGTTFEAAKKASEEWRSRYPDLEIAIYKDKNYFHAALAGFATDKEIEIARQRARRIGIPLSDIRSFKLETEDKLERLNQLGESAIEGWKKIQTCYSGGAVTVGELHRCSGQWFTPKIITRCILENECDGIDDSLLPTIDRVKAYYVSQGLDFAEGKLKLELAPNAIPLPEDGLAFVNGMIACKHSSEADAGLFQQCLATQVLKDAKTNAKSLECLSANKRNEEVFQCLISGGTVPYLSGKEKCLAAEGLTAAAMSKCLLDDDSRKKLVIAENCLKSNPSERTALMSCLGAGMSADSRDKVACVTANASSQRALLQCFVAGNSDAKLAEIAFGCASRPNISSQEAAICLSKLVGGDVGKAAACASSSSDTAAAVGCMLEGNENLHAAHAAYKCAANATSAAAIIAYCSGNAIDPRAKAVAACVASSSGDFVKSAAGCAAASYLPPELANAASCAARSTGAVDAALCIGAPSMNAELRMALECASSTGGEPISFVSCTAGRLTAAELTKCLSGRVGKDCFGPGNTLVVAFATVGNDLSNCASGKACLGPSNEYTKAAKFVEKTVADTGEAAGKAWNDLFGPGTAWCRGDLTGWTCPGKGSDWCRGDLTGWTC